MSFYEIFGLGVAYLMLYDHALHSIFNFTVFHAYIPFLFYLSVLACDCVLSLFLSLSLSKRLHMVPKRKSAPIWNHFRSGSSSSDPPVPLLDVRFLDKKAHQDFSKNFSKRGVHPKRHVILSNFEDTSLLNIIHTRG